MKKTEQSRPSCLKHCQLKKLLVNRAPDKRGIEGKSQIIFLISPRKHVLTPHYNNLNETVLMMGHKICFHGEIWKIIPKLSLLPLLTWSTGQGFSKFSSTQSIKYLGNFWLKKYEELLRSSSHFCSCKKYQYFLNLKNVMSQLLCQFWTKIPRNALSYLSAHFHKTEPNQKT